MSVDSKSLMKWPLIIAAALVIVRTVLEQLGAPESVNNIFGVAWLYFLVPVYFALHIAASGDPSPFKTLFKNLVIFTAITRLFIMPTYWLAYLFNWSAPRFAIDRGGVVGEDVSALFGLVWIPVRNLVIWVVLATVVGMILGGITLLVKRRAPAESRAA